MHQNKADIVYVIPARSGSKGVKDKNIRKLGSRSLIEIAIDCILEHKPNATIILNSDSKSYLAQTDREVIKYHRSSNLAQDDTLMCDVLNDMEDNCRDYANHSIVSIVQTTCPFRLPVHFQMAEDEFFIGKSNYSSDKIFTGIRDLDVSTGASRDLKHADVIARNYIDVFGYYNEGDSVNRMLPTPDNSQTSLSENKKSEIDAAVIDLINYGLDRAIDIIEHNLDTFNTLATNLIEKKLVDIKYLDTLNVTYF